MLDIEAAGAVAPGANIVVYFAPNSSQGFLDAITTAVHDTANRPSVISISWGSAEQRWTHSALLALEAAFADAGLLGVTVCAAAGDGGSADGILDGSAHVDFPASSPHVLGCGGTKLEASNGLISSEVAWNATGGGVSKIFALPNYQSAVGVTSGNHRGVPDVAGNADPDTGYLVRIDGARFIIGGTSAVAPLWAGLVALMNENLGESVGFLHPYLYKQPAAATFRDITQGGNDVSGLGVFTAGPGWDPCTGWGTPDGRRLLAAVSGELTRQGIIAHLPRPVGVAGYVTGDNYQHVIAANGNGDIHEIYWQGGGAVAQGVVATVPNVNRVAAYVTAADGVQHVIASAGFAQVLEIFWPGGGQPSQAVLDWSTGQQIANVVGVAGYFTADDGFQHVIVACGDDGGSPVQGDIFEVYFKQG